MFTRFACSTAYTVLYTDPTCTFEHGGVDVVYAVSFEISIEKLRRPPTRPLVVGDAHYYTTPSWMSADTTDFWNAPEHQQ